jgi:hypothetical protein
MNMLFDMPPFRPNNPKLPPTGKRCRNCEYCRNLNPYSDRYWYCIITPSRRTSYNVKAIKRMDSACVKFKEKKK